MKKGSETLPFYLQARVCILRIFPPIYLQRYNQSTTPVKSLHVKYCKYPPFSLTLTEKKLRQLLLF